MSTIDKLSIRGIRCFGLSQQEEAVITFSHSPVTLIVGQNGAGKTTVIECLRYMTTGEFPPNSKGGAFVIDPKLVGEREVKAVVKLRFTNVKGESVVCHRIIQSEQKPTRIEQKQLDGSLEKKDKTTGEKVKITSRCTEINSEMITNLGVSKAILNHVIFCHQEESNWPLSEGKALKTKFDEIFASTRYSKALDNIKIVQKTQKEKCNEYATSLKYLKEEKRKAEDLRKRAKDLQKIVDSLKGEEKVLSEQLAPIEEKLDRLKTKFEEVAKFEKEIATLEASSKELTKQRVLLSENIIHPFTGSLEELELQFSQHENQQERKQKSLDDCERKLMKVGAEESDMKMKINKLSEERGRLESEEQYYIQAVNYRDSRIGKLSNELGISGYSGSGNVSLSNEAIRLFVSEVTELTQKKKGEINEWKAKLKEKETSIQETLNDLQDTLSRLKQKKEMKEKQLQENEKELITLNRQLSRIATTNSDFDRIDLNLKQATKELNEYQEGVDINQMERDLSLLQEKKEAANNTLHLVQKEMNIITRESGARGALESMRKDKQSKEQEYDKEFNSIESDILSLIGHMPGDDELESAVAELERTRRTSVAQGQSKVTKWKHDQLKLRTEIDGALKQMKTKQDHLNGIDKEVEKFCGSTSYEDKCREVKTEITAKEENLTAIKGSEAFFKECLSKARSSKKCPLCARGYDSQEGLNNLITSIERRLTAKVPELVKSFQQQMTQLRTTHEKLLQLMPQMDEAQSLRTTEIPSLQNEIDEKKSLLDKLSTDTSEVESQLTINQKQLDQLRELRPRVAKLSQMRQTLDVLDRKISSELSKLGGENVRSHAVVQRELQKAQMEWDELGRKMDNKRQEIGTCQRSISELEKKVNYYQQEQLNLQKQVQERQSYIKKKEELTAANQGLLRDIQGAERQLKPLETKLAVTRSEKESAVKEREEKEKLSRQEMHQLDTNVNNLNSSILEVNKLEAKRMTGTLEQCREQMAELSKLIEMKFKEKQKLDETREELRSSLTNSKIRERELQDNIELLKIDKKLNDINKQIKDYENQLKQQGLDQYKRDLQKFQAQSSELSKQLGLKRGNRLTKEGELTSVQRELHTDMYRNADKSHRDMYIKLKTTEIAIDDLNKFHKALDRAIMQYHNYKMSEINKIIRELWLKTYKGGDIDTIEIRSDDDSEGTKATGRRTYNYRVVMVKGDTALDMRGRCSAGQKVIASIIIRLALAESFCLHCGLLALDEPTTNLDSENVEGLALALSEIIRERSRQRNFQLIIITHDLGFVELLGRSEFVGEYHLIKKEEGACSTVKKIPINELSAYN